MFTFVDIRFFKTLSDFKVKDKLRKGVSKKGCQITNIFQIKKIYKNLNTSHFHDFTSHKIYFLKKFKLNQLLNRNIISFLMAQLFDALPLLFKYYYHFKIVYYDKSGLDFFLVYTRNL